MNTKVNKTKKETYERARERERRHAHRDRRVACRDDVLIAARADDRSAAGSAAKDVAAARRGSGAHRRRIR